jgi:hypothetical protein
VGVGVVGLLVVVGGALGLLRGSAPPAQAIAVVVPSPMPPSPPSMPPPTFAVEPTVTPSTTRKPPAVYYKNCGVALAEGAAPIQKGEPGYRTGLDPDGDGVACPVN